MIPGAKYLLATFCTEDYAMNLNQLYYFQTIAEVRNYTRAGEMLYVTQSSLSHSMATLEEELGIPLFYKSGRNMLLTPYGTEFLEYAKRALKELENGKERIRTLLNPNKGIIRLSFVSTFSSHFISQAIQSFYQNEENREISFTFDEKPTLKIVKDFDLHMVDIGFGSYTDDKNLIFHPLMDEELVVVVPKEHPLAERDAVDLKELAKEKLIIYNQSSMTRPVILSMFEELGITPDIGFEVVTDHMIASFISNNLGVGIMPKMFGLELYNVKPLPIINKELRRALYMFRPKNTFVFPAVQKFWDFIVDEFPC